MDKKDFWKKIKNVALKIQDAKKKKDHIEGLMKDINKVISIADNAFNKKVGSDAALLRIGWEALAKTSTKANPLLRFYTDYHGTHINALAGVLKVKDMHSYILKWKYEVNKMANDLSRKINDITRKYSYASSMMNNTGSMSINLPRNFTEYYEKNSTSMFIANSSDNPSQINEREQLGLFIIETAMEISATYLTCKGCFSDLLALGIKGAKMLRKLKKSKASVDIIGSKSIEKFMQEEWVSNGLNFDADFNLFLRGSWFESRSVKKAGAAMRDMKELAYTWKRWAQQVKSDDSYLCNF